MAKVVKKKKEPTLEEKLEQAVVPVDEQPYQVPENWCWIRFGEITINYDKKRIPLSAKQRSLLDKVYDYYGASGIIDKVDKYIFDQELLLIGEDGANLLYRSTDIAFLASGKYWVNNHAHIVDTLICSRQYMKYYINSIDLSPFITGTAQPKLTQDNMNSIPIPISPAQEQQRIVDRIESLFAKLDEAKEKAQAVVDGFEDRKAAILHKAFTGELTAGWRKASLLGSHWKPTKFKDFCLLKRGFDLPAANRIQGNYPLVSSSGIIDTHITPKVKGPGVITGRSGSIGKVFHITEDYWPLNTTLYSERLYDNDARFVFYRLQTFDFKSFSSSTAVPTLNRNLFLDEIISVPPIEEQKEIVYLLDSLLEKEQQAKEAAEQVISQIDTMKKSILARAFRGELGTNDPADESAVEMLKRVL